MAQIIHISERAQGIAALEAERETLQADAQRITMEQIQVMEIAFDAVTTMGKRQEEILRKMIEVEAAQAKLMGGEPCCINDRRSRRSLPGSI